MRMLSRIGWIASAALAGAVVSIVGLAACASSGSNNGDGTPGVATRRGRQARMRRCTGEAYESPVPVAQGLHLPELSGIILSPGQIDFERSVYGMWQTERAEQNRLLQQGMVAHDQRVIQSANDSLMRIRNSERDSLRVMLTPEQKLVFDQNRAALNYYEATRARSESEVDHPASLVSGPSGQRSPEYPAWERNNGRDGEVVLRFVVDTAGRAEPSSMVVVMASSQRFMESVCTFIAGAKFTPATIGDRPVRQAVEEPFSFSLH